MSIGTTYNCTMYSVHVCICDYCESILSGNQSVAIHLYPTIQNRYHRKPFKIIKLT